MVTIITDELDGSGENDVNGTDDSSLKTQSDNPDNLLNDKSSEEEEKFQWYD